MGGYGVLVLVVRWSFRIRILRGGGFSVILFLDLGILGMFVWAGFGRL